MELHRLKPMGDYDPKLFNELYEKVQPLKRKLISQIDPRKFGVEKEDIACWFDDKFIYVFNKYINIKEKNILLGYIINSLQTFKYKVISRSYQQQYSLYSSPTIDISDTSLKYILTDEKPDDHSLFIEIMIEFFQSKLSPAAFEIFILQLYPPYYITCRLDNNTQKIPTNLILDFLGIPNDQAYINKVNKIRRVINSLIPDAREHLNPRIPNTTQV